MTQPNRTQIIIVVGITEIIIIINPNKQALVPVIKTTVMTWELAF